MRDRDRELDCLFPACFITPDLNSNEASKPAETLVGGNWVRSGDLTEIWLFFNRHVPSVVNSLFFTKACLQCCRVLLPSACSCHVPPTPRNSHLDFCHHIHNSVGSKLICLSSWPNVSFACRLSIARGYLHKNVLVTESF